MAHSIKISLMALAFSKQEEEKKEKMFYHCVRIGNEL